ncbi:MAG: transcriptional activator RfaH [Candidatus Solibacter sp.]|jgi:transcription antitermination factor NusG|nr:transcriptional activator RfaH [Candidatus Solibacter sp.]
MHADDNLAWFALQARPRFERNIARLLCEKGFEPFLPLYNHRREWRHRTVTLETPLFPGYLFCRLDPGKRMPVLTTPGVLGVLGVGKVPMPIPDAEIEDIRRIVQSGSNVEAFPYVTEGQRVRIANGPLSGMEGIVIDVTKRRRITVSINLLQRSVAATIDPDVELIVIGPQPTRIPAGRAGAGNSSLVHLA